MQPTLVDEIPSGAGYIHEIKYDGYRTQLIIEDGSARAFTRNGNDWTTRYGPIVSDALLLDCRSAIIDGEACMQDERGVTDFALMQANLKRHPELLVYFAFDLLHLDGEDLRGAPLEERRSKLRWLLRNATGRVRMSDEYDGDGKALFALADSMGLEGVVSKKKGSRYTSGTTKTWLKTKAWATEDFEVIGITRGADGVPYALLADESGYRGAAYLTLPVAVRSLFWRYVDTKTIASPTVADAPKKNASWIQPGLRASVRFLKGSDKLRHAAVKKVDLGPKKH